MRSSERRRGLRRALLAALVLATSGARVWWSGALARAEDAAEATAAEAVVAPDLFARSKGFRELLDAMRERSQQLDRREQALAAREATVRAVEALVNERLAQLERAPGTGPCRAAVPRIYQSMRPQEAAPLIERLDDATVKTVLGCMRARQVGAILAAMRRERALALTKALATDF